MKSFKDYLQQDIAATFINKNEFAEIAIVNGKEADVVIDSDVTLKKNVTVTKRMKIDDRIGNDTVVFSIAKSFFKHIPQTERPMNFNGVDYKIAHVADDIGMLTITLTRYLG